MTTIASLDIGTQIDTAGIGRGLSVVEQQLARFGNQIDGKSTGSDIAEGMLSGLQQRLEQAQSTMQAAFERGLVDPSQMAELGDKAAAEYKSGLAKGIGNLAVQGLVNDEVREKFELAFGRVGESSAIAFNASFAATANNVETFIRGTGFSSTQAESIAGLEASQKSLQATLAAGNLTLQQRVQIEEELARVQRTLAAPAEAAAAAEERLARAAQEAAANAGLLGKFVNRNTGEFTQLGRRASTALVGISFALDGLAISSGDALTSVHSILRTAATLGPALGPQGLVVAAVAAGTDAIISIFTKTRDEMQKTEEEFLKRIQAMQDVGDSSGLQRQLQTLDIGLPSTGKSPFGEFNVGGIEGMAAELADAQHRLEEFKKTGQDTQSAFAAGKGIGTFNQEAEDLRKRVAELTPKLKELRAQRESLVNAILLPSVPITDASGFPSGEGSGAVSTLDKLSDRVANLASAAALASAAMEQIPEATVGVDAAIAKNEESARRFVATYQQEALAAFDEVTAAIRAHGPAFDSDLAKLAQLRTQLAAIPAVQLLRIEAPEVTPIIDVIGKLEAIEPPPKVPEIKVPVSPEFQHFDEMAKRLSDLDAARKAAEGAGLSDETSRRAAAEAAQVLALTAAWRDYVQTLIAGHASTEELAEAQRRLEKALKDAGQDGENIGDGLSKSGDGLNEAAQAAHRLGDAFGGVGDHVGDVLSSIEDMRRSMDSLKAPKIDFSGIAAGAGSLIGILSSVGGLIASIGQPSPVEQEHDRILNENNQALANLAASLDRFGETAGSIQNVQDAVAKIVGSGIQFQLGPVSDEPTKQAREILAQYNLTLEQANKIAKDYGITLLDNGRVVDDAFTQFADALGISSELLLTWGKSFDQLQSLQKLSDRAHGIEDTPGRELANTIKSITDTAGPAIDALFEGIDTSTKAGREQLRKVIAGLVDQIELGAKPGGLTLADLEGFKDVQDFGGALNDALDGLDAFDKGLGAVTDSLLNVPEIFKLARVRFESALPEVPTMPTGPTGPQGPPQVPTTAPPEPPVVIPPLVFPSDFTHTIENVLDQLGAVQDSGIRSVGDTITAALGGGLDVSIGDSQFDALLAALREASPGAGATDGGDINISGDIYVDARTKSVREAWSETLAMLRQETRSGGIPLAGVRVL